MRTSTVKRFALITFTTAGVLTVIIWQYVYPLSIVYSWLISITAITTITFGYDKIVAGSDRTRVPENVLLALSFAGGTIGALVGMILFRHKTASSRFRSKFLLVIGAQILLLLVCYIWIRPNTTYKF